jgi:NAD(P)-dependent dehydrogenase (short-subunit alcohol dehydrogenase family)
MTIKIDNLFGIQDKVVAITGAGGIIYGTVAKALATNGAKLALLDILGDKVLQLANEINTSGGKAIAIKCDVLNAGNLEAALEGILKEFGNCDALINGAGGNRKGATVRQDGDLTQLSFDELEKVFALNYKGTALPSQIFCKYFAQKGKGIIINTSSMCAIAPMTNVPGYSNAKAAVTNFTRWLAVQVKVDFPDADIRVNEVVPGFLDTTQNHYLLYEPDDKTLTRRGRSIISHTPLGRFGSSQELIGPIILLLSNAGSFLHGVSLCVDGGFSIYSGVGPLDEKKKQ